MRVDSDSLLRSWSLPLPLGEVCPIWVELASQREAFSPGCSVNGSGVEYGQSLYGVPVWEAALTAQNKTRPGGLRGYWRS